MNDLCHAVVKPSSTAGRGLYASKELGVGAAIYSTQRVLVAALDEARWQDTCDNCYLWKDLSDVFDAGHQGEIKLKVCTGCKLVKYCCKRCQAQAWQRFHKRECKLLPGMKNSHATPQSQAAVRLQLMRELGTLTNEEYSAVADLQARHGTTATDSTQNAKIWKERLVPQIQCNALTLVASTYDPLGVALDPLVSMANHSCQPNAFVVFDGPQISLRTLTAVPKDSEIFISYIDTTYPFSWRQEELKKRYSFICKCGKCQKGPTLKEDLFLRSSEEVGDSLRTLLRQSQIDLERHSKSTAFYVGPSPQEKALAVFQAGVFSTLENGKTMLNTGTADKGLTANSQFRTGFSMCRDSKIWPITRQPYVALRHELMVEYIESGSQADAWRQAVIMTFVIDPQLYPGMPHHPIRVVHMWTLLKITLSFYSEQENPRLHTLMSKGLDCVVAICCLLRELSNLVPRSHGPSQFSRAVERQRLEIKAELDRSGARLSGSDLDKQQKILHQLAVEASKEPEPTPVTIPRRDQKLDMIRSSGVQT